MTSLLMKACTLKTTDCLCWLKFQACRINLNRKQNGKIIEEQRKEAVVKFKEEQKRKRKKYVPTSESVVVNNYSFIC